MGMNVTETKPEMKLNTMMTPAEKAVVDAEVDRFNKANVDPNGRTSSNQLGKDEFLKLLVEQLKHQDPTSPMEDTQFISQMAQFSSLEQMTNLNTSFQKMSSYFTSSEAYSTLGKDVEISIGDTTTKGIVTGVTRGEKPQVVVNGMYYDMDKIKAIYAD